MDEFVTVQKKDLLRRCARNSLRDEKSIFKQEMRLKRRLNQIKAVIDAQLFYLKTVKGQPGEVMTQSAKNEILG